MVYGPYTRRNVQIGQASVSGTRARYFRNRRYNRRYIGGKRKLFRGIGGFVHKHMFKQTVIPTTNSIQLSGTGGGYNAALGILYGPNNTAGTDLLFSIKFLLSELPQVGSFTALFDAYKISKVVVKLVPMISQVQQPASVALVGTSTEHMNTVIDKDDSTPLSNISDALQYETFKQTPGYKYHKRAFVPAVSMQAFKTSGTTIGFVQKKQQWIDIAYTDVEHYGMKGVVQDFGTSNVQMSWKIYVTYYISMKQVR